MESYPYGYCGMTCALCSRNRTEGKSRCLGCSEGGYYTDMCKVYRCCREKNLRHCALCELYPCERLVKMKDFRDLNTDNVKRRTGEYIKKNSFEKWCEDYSRKAELLTFALSEYNDGRMKRYLCELFIVNALPVLEEVMKEAEKLTGEKKEKAKAFRLLADEVINKTP